MNEYQTRSANLYGASSPRALSPYFYTDAEITRQEVQEIFRKEWICVGRTTDWPENFDYMTFDLAAEPVVVWRTANGELKAYENVCRHRMAIIASGEGHAKTLSCPYHKWTYGSDGALRGAPCAKNELDGLDIRLVELCLEEWQGFVFVNADKHAEPLAPRLSGLSKLIDVYQLDSYVWSQQSPSRTTNANWKIVAENGYEGYHIFAVHPETLAPYVTRKASPPPGEYWSVSYEPRNSAFPETPEDPPGLGEKERTDAFTIGVFPSMFFNIDGDTVVWLTTLPNGPNQCTILSGMTKRVPAHLRRLGDTEALSEDKVVENTLKDFIISQYHCYCALR